jgi:hypothetical protein
LWCSTMFSHSLIVATSIVLISHSHQGWLGFSPFNSPKEAAQPLDANFNQQMGLHALNFWVDVRMSSHLHVEGHSTTFGARFSQRLWVRCINCSKILQ